MTKKLTSKDIEIPTDVYELVLEINELFNKNSVPLATGLCALLSAFVFQFEEFTPEDKAQMNSMSIADNLFALVKIINETANKNPPITH